VHSGPKLSIRLYLDEHIPLKLAETLRERGHDAVHTYEVGMGGASDEEQIEFAVQEGRTILTYNIKHFAQLHRRCWETGHEPCGIVVSDELPFGELLSRILKLLDTVTAQEMRGQLRFLSEFAHEEYKRNR